MIRQWLLGLTVLLYQQSGMAALDHGYPAWNGLLQKHVQWNATGTATRVSYTGLRAEQQALTALLDELAEVDLAEYRSWSVAQRRAFLINAYNAWTVQRILQAEDLPESIRDLGSWFSSVWKQSFVQLLGDSRSLDEVEHQWLRGAPDYDDPRIHFAVNCASIGCPALRPEAYVAARLDAQLHDQTERFLRDRTRNRYAAATQTLYLSKIFDWYAEDFERGLRGSHSVSAFLQSYGEALAVDPAVLLADELSIEYTDYDWLLNGE